MKTNPEKLLKEILDRQLQIQAALEVLPFLVTGVIAAIDKTKPFAQHDKDIGEMMDFVKAEQAKRHRRLKRERTKKNSIPTPAKPAPKPR